MATYLVTGGSGFLGINMVRYLLAKGETVRSFDIAPFDYPEASRVEVMIGDIRDTAAVATACRGVDIVIHAAAALPLYSAKDIHSTDVDGTRNVLTEAFKAGAQRVVQVSSTAVYGIPDHHPLYETDCLHGVGPYGEAKIEAEKACEEFRAKGKCVPVIRPKSFIGPERLGVFALFYDWAADGKNFPMIGSGENRYQLLDVEDLCDAIYAAATLPEEKANGTFNIGAKEFTTMKEDYQAVLDVAGFGKRIIPLPRWPVIMTLRVLEFLHLSPLYKWVYGTASEDSFVSIEKAEKELGFKPKYSNKQALVRNYEWYLAHRVEFKGQSGVSHRVPWSQGVLRIAKWFFGFRLDYIFENLPLIFLSVVTLIAAAIPVAIGVMRAAPVWAGVPPPYITDALFYFAKISAIAGGHLFFGNPYYLEHAGGVATSFSISEWLAAIPYVLTHSWAFTILWNIFFWTFAFSVLSYFVFRVFGLGKWGSAFGALLMLSQSFSGLFRPIVMQVPYTVFALVLVAVGLFLAKPQQGSRIALLAFAGALSVYTYTFLGQIAVASLTILFAMFAFMRSWREVRSLAVVALVSAALLIPFALVLYVTMTDPNYLDTLIRYGLVRSHLPAAYSFFYVRWLILILVAWGVVWSYARNALESIDWQRMSAGCAFALGTLAALMSPVVTGNDVDSASHLGRFVLPILALNAVFIIAVISNSRVRALLARPLPCLMLFLLGLLAAVGLARSTYLENIPQVPSRDDIASVEEYAPVLHFLAALPPSVVWADDALSPYVPVMTHDYVLSAQQAKFYLLSQQEIEERSLANQNPAPGALDRFHVRYVVRDILHDVSVNPQLIQGKQIYDDGRFVVYERML